MATKRIKDISTTATTFAADDFIALDASSVGTRKMAKASLITQVGANYLEKADNLSDVADKDTAKLNLEVPNVGTAANEVPVNGMLGTMAFQSADGVVVDDLTVDGQLTAAVGKPMPVNGPTMRFDGSNDYVEFADNDAFSFTNGTDDTPLSVSAWVKIERSLTTQGIISKFGTSLMEWAFYLDSSNRLNLSLRDSGGDYNGIRNSYDMSAHVGEFIHITGTYSGSGPNSANSFANAYQGMTLYVNGKALSGSTQSNSGTYDGMTNTSQPLWVGKRSTDEFGGEIRDVKLFNKELSAAEVKEVYSNGSLGFAESTGGADGGIYTSDFSSGVDGFTGTARGTIDGNIDSIGGQNDNLRFTVSTDSGSHYTTRSMLLSGKRNRIEFDYYIPSSNSDLNGFQLYNGTTDFVDTYDTPTLDAWTRHSSEATVDGSTVLYVQMRSNGASSFTDSGGNDVFYLRNVRITQIGSVLDARAENYNQSAGKLLDVSGNDFVGTQSGGVELLTPRSHLSAGTLDLTNLPTSATGLSAGEVYNSSGTLKIV